MYKIHRPQSCNIAYYRVFLHSTIEIKNPPITLFSKEIPHLSLISLLHVFGPSRAITEELNILQ